MLMMTGVRHNWGEEPGDWDLRVEDSRQPTSPTSVNLLKPTSQNYVWLICKTIFNYRELGFILTFLWYFFLLFVTVRNCWSWLHCLCFFIACPPQILHLHHHLVWRHHWWMLPTHECFSPPHSPHQSIKV